MTVKPSSPRLIHRIEYSIFTFLKKITLSRSGKVVQGLEWLLYVLLYYVFRICRKIVKVNLDIAYPEHFHEEKHHIAKENYRWFAKLSFDILRMDSRKGQTEQLVQFKNLHILDEALKEERGVLLVSGHFGNWEMIVPALAEKGYPMYMYVGAQSNPLVNEHHNKVRQTFGIHTIDKGKSATLQMGRALISNGVIAMLVDQNDRKSSLFVNFFGKRATISKGVSAFYLMKKSPIVFVSCPYVDNSLMMDFQRIQCELSDDKEQNLQNVSQAVTSALESTIRQFPEQYFWMHRRWRTRPPDDPQKIY